MRSNPNTRMQPTVTLLLMLILCCATPPARAKTGILNTKHNLSVSGPGEVRALTETRVCVFCHTPHNAAPNTPLWNKDLDAVNYTIYESSTSKAVIEQPFGPTRLCLSCHDGTVALGAVKSVPAGIQMTFERITPDRRSYIGTDISDDHPVSFSYHTAQPNSELASTFPDIGVSYYDFVHCSTCHDAHDDTYGKFLVMNNEFSALCTSCHIKNGWLQTTHRTSTATWNGSGINPWFHTDWLTVAENGCENCHSPHSAGGPKRLLNYAQEEQVCYPCHNGNVAATNIEAEFTKVYRHPVAATTIGITPEAHDPAEDISLLSGHVECVDCHNPHASNAATASAPNASGRLNLVSGITKDGVKVDAVTFEYEVCFKCHGDSSTLAPYIDRYINNTNNRQDFDPINPSYHPVVAIGKNPDVLSLPSAFEPDLTASSMIYCTDCHDNNNSPKIGGTGPRGPHGSIYPPILRQRYETADFTAESASAYALCYRCHDRDNLLNTTPGVGSFRYHRKHVVEEQAPCSACHDPHGIRDDGVSGSHTHLINFNASIVQPSGMVSVPQFVDTGTHSGYCMLNCHGRMHGPGMNYP